MAQTVTIDALRQELWSKDLLDDVQRDIESIMKFAGEDANNVVQINSDLQKEKGDTESFGLVARLSGFGVTGDDELEGNEESMSSFDEHVLIDMIRNAVRLRGKLDAQKVIYDQIAVARGNLQTWMKEFIVQQLFLKLGGVTNTTLTDVNGIVVGTRALWSNTPDFIPDVDEAYTGTRARYLNAGAVTTASLTTAHTLTLDLVTDMATKATLASPKIQRISGNGQDFYVLYVHPLQATQLRKSADWKTANEIAQQRGEDNPVFRGAIGYWSNVLILENEFVPYLDHTVALNSFRGPTTGTDCAVDVCRALLCGRQAVLMAQASNPEALVVEQFDYKNKDGIAATFIGGIQKPIFNSKEFGVIACDSYVAK
jgi:N4-gp56 family major capsid protein